MHSVDWMIIIGFIIVLIFVAVYTRKFNRSVADFLAANRCAGRYILSVSGTMAGWGAISYIAMFQMFYKVGFTADWWLFLWQPLTVLLAITGWVTYRYRQTRTLTLAQFFEVRYNKSFRIYAGILGYISGILNFGIFPAVGARFFIYYCGLPVELDVLGIEVKTFVFIMFILLLLALFFTFIGGQISILITDFLQGIFANVIFLLVFIFFLWKFGWLTIFEGVSFASSDASMVQPLKTSKADSFNAWYFLIGAFNLLYNRVGWQGSHGYQTSAISAHENKMSGIMQQWSMMGQRAMMVFPCVCAFVVMYHSDFIDIKASVDSILNSISNEQIKDQLTVPVVFRNILPVGLLGLFAAAIFAAFISTHDSYLHSFGSIFVQDVLLPLTGKKLSPKEHIKWLKFSIFGVAAFIFFYSMFFPQSQHIYLYMAITGSIFLGGAGSVVIGGLYWKRGTTQAAFASMTTGSILAVSGLVVPYIWQDFIFNGQQMFFFAMITSVVVYIIVSLIWPGNNYNLDKMLHRGKYAIKGDGILIDAPETLRERLGITAEFSNGDRLLSYGLFVLIGLWWIFFLIITVLNIFFDISLSWWQGYIKLRVIFILIMSGVTTIWFSIGGFRDAIKMFKRLSGSKINEHDDGTVADDHNLADDYQ